jgi:hypothetical protein
MASNDPPMPADSEPDELQDPNDEPEQPARQAGRQKAMAAVLQLHPPEMLAKFCTGFKKANIIIVENVRLLCIPGNHLREYCLTNYESE